jgi:hypothetical protein
MIEPKAIRVRTSITKLIMVVPEIMRVFSQKKPRRFPGRACRYVDQFVAFICLLGHLQAALRAGEVVAE